MKTTTGARQNRSNRFLVNAVPGIGTAQRVPQTQKTPAIFVTGENNGENNTNQEDDEFRNSIGKVQRIRFPLYTRRTQCATMKNPHDANHGDHFIALSPSPMVNTVADYVDGLVPTVQHPSASASRVSHHSYFRSRFRLPLPRLLALTGFAFLPTPG